MSFNIADVFELAVDHFAEREYLVCDHQRRTYAEMESRANQLAHYLQMQGIRQGDHVGIYAMNCIEWVEAIWATLKIRALYININYRYVADELAYIFDNADLKAVIVQAKYLPLLDQLSGSLPKLEHVLVIKDSADIGSSEPSLASANISLIAYESALAGQSSQRDFPVRSSNDHYIVYTGGTTGMPKGVLWRHQEVMYALGGGVDQLTQQPVERPQEIIDRGKDGSMTVMSIAPLMHGAAQWSCISRAFEGGKVVLMPQFTADKTWQLIEKEHINSVFIVGDAMARPMIESFLASVKKPNVDSLFLLASSGAIFSASIKDQFFDCFPKLMIVDSIGASEVGGQGVAMIEPGKTAMTGGGPTVTPLSGTVVLDEKDLTIIPAGSPSIGKVARRGYIPVEYYKDPAKTAATFVIAADGYRYAMPGDYGKVEQDGRITLLGRGSVSINSGGEKIFPEEVEAAIKAHDEIFDCVVCGVPDKKWGSRVAVVAQSRSLPVPSLEAIQIHCRTKLAGYKIPRQIHYVDSIPRSPAGKPDYQWAINLAQNNITK